MSGYTITKILSPEKKVGQGGRKGNEKVHECQVLEFLNRNKRFTLILKALLKPLAKKPPNGAIIDANKLKHKACHLTGKIAISFQVNCNILLKVNY